MSGALHGLGRETHENDTPLSDSFAQIAIFLGFYSGLDMLPRKVGGLGQQLTLKIRTRNWNVARNS